MQCSGIIWLLYSHIITHRYCLVLVVVTLWGNEKGRAVMDNSPPPFLSLSLEVWRNASGDTFLISQSHLWSFSCQAIIYQANLNLLLDYWAWQADKHAMLSLSNLHKHIFSPLLTLTLVFYISGKYNKFLQVLQRSQIISFIIF